MSSTLPRIIQGGMGIGISHWGLARAVSAAGQLGVVSGTAIDTVLVRRLQDGDPGGHMRRALAHFPWPAVAHDILERWFRSDGRGAGEPYQLLPMHRQVVSRRRNELTVAAGFVEVWLAREGHDNAVGINLLTKVQLPNLATLYGAMLAGVGVVLMGAGIPKEIPGALDRLAGHEPASLRLDLENAERGDTESVTFDPGMFGARPPALERPLFLPIVSASSLAAMLARKSNGRVDGFVVEGPRAGGHNAPPRGSAPGSASVVYGERDIADLEAMRALGLPFWLAGGTGTPDALRAALRAGAAGVQVGTLFAYARESGMEPGIRSAILERAAVGDVTIRTDGRASPTGYPFKVVELEDSAADETRYASRERICDLGYLRVPFRDDTGRLAYRCAAEPVAAYVAKGGDEADTEGRRCLCNALLADIGLPQVRDGDVVEPPLITSGDDLADLATFLRGRTSYSVTDVLAWLDA
jgi:nitronate monooxygenase